MTQAKFTALLAKIHERNNNLDAAIRALSETKDIRSRIVKRVQVEQPDGIEERASLPDPEDEEISLDDAGDQEEHNSEETEAFPDPDHG